MNDQELFALAALVMQETELMRAENVDRQNNGYSAAYTVQATGFGENAQRLEAELKRRRESASVA